MPCIAALPDGTYLIVNGAQQGVAGFGLASEPNLNALLYDPTQPVGQRISILNNTIVPRLYHSEATVCYVSNHDSFYAHSIMLLFSFITPVTA